MQRIIPYTLDRLIARGFLIILATVLFGSTALCALPERGTHAPSLNSVTLLQAPSGAKADWASLKGKVVVLEFWATWCSPCVASLPHLNQLVASLDPAKFQFISIDDEDQKAVEKFLTTKKTSGWVGTDTSGRVFTRYGITSRPTTVIVDGSGKVVAVTEIDAVNAADLQAVALGKHVAFQAVSDIAAVRVPPSAIAKGPLFAVSVSKASPGKKRSVISHPPTGTDFLGETADDLMTDVFNAFGNRYVLKDPLPEERYDLRVTADGVPQAVVDSVVQQAVLAALHLQIQPKTVTRRVYILRATDTSKGLLSPSASTHSVKRGYWHSIYILMNGTMDDLAYVLATGLENPVVNQTGIDGTYDARFKVAGDNIDSLNAVLRTALGLEIVPGDQEATITVLEVSKRAEGAPSLSTKTQALRH